MYFPVILEIKQPLCLDWSLAQSWLSHCSGGRHAACSLTGDQAHGLCWTHSPWALLYCPRYKADGCAGGPGNHCYNCYSALPHFWNILKKNISIDKKFFVWYVIFFCPCMDRWTDNWQFLWWMILAVMSIVGNNSWELPRTGQSFTHQRQQTFIVPVMKVWSSFKTFQFSIPPSLNSNSCLKFKVNRLSSLEMHSSFYLVWFAFYNLWTDVQTYKVDSLK